MYSPLIYNFFRHLHIGGRRMKIFRELNKELKEKREGSYTPYYYRYLGYKKDLAARPADLRANGIHSLFTATTPVILKNELIAGNRLSLFTNNINPVVLEYAKNTVDRFRERWFETCRDHFAPDYRRILSLGIPGLINEIDASLLRHRNDGEKCETLRSMRLTLVGFSEMIGNYISAAEKSLTDKEYNKERLEGIINTSRALLKGKPSSFKEALQLVWYCHNAFLMEERYAMALGRLDQYLYPFYKNDTEKGLITDDEVTELLENIFIRLQDDVVNICIGGQNVRGECEINGLSLCILRAVGNCNVPGPNLSLRLTKNTPDEFLDECLKVIGTGLGYPAIMNDDINIAALKKYGYDEEDVYDYCMVGCIENFISGKQPPWSDSIFNTPGFLDFVFNDGISETGHTVGINTGRLESIKTMDDFMHAYERQLEYGADEYYSRINSASDSLNQKYIPDPFMSCFCYDCIGRGLDIHNGGVKYPSVHGAVTMGIGTVSDSLAAIEKVVFIDKEATLEELRDALNSNFEGYEVLREKLLAAPKYGNNDDFVDKYAVWFIDYLSSLFEKYHTYDGGRFYIAAAANINNIYSGSVTNATPDGRKRGEPLSDAASPGYGRDTKGPTSTVNSVSKPDYTKVACGTVVNQKYSPEMFSDEKRGKLLAIIRTLFKKGGQEIQINATSREILKKAMDEPENYSDLVVRVSGFSAFYITLDRAVQLDILNRTQHE